MDRRTFLATTGSLVGAGCSQLTAAERTTEVSTMSAAECEAAFGQNAVCYRTLPANPDDVAYLLPPDDPTVPATPEPEFTVVNQTDRELAVDFDVLLSERQGSDWLVVEPPVDHPGLSTVPPGERRSHPSPPYENVTFTAGEYAWVASGHFEEGRDWHGVARFVVDPAWEGPLSL